MLIKDIYWWGNGQYQITFLSQVIYFEQVKKHVFEQYYTNNFKSLFWMQVCSVYIWDNIKQLQGNSEPLFSDSYMKNKQVFG